MAAIVAAKDRPRGISSERKRPITSPWPSVFISSPGITTRSRPRACSTASSAAPPAPAGEAAVERVELGRDGVEALCLRLRAVLRGGAGAVLLVLGEAGELRGRELRLLAPRGR